jgi:hypothetical protein
MSTSRKIIHFKESEVGYNKYLARVRFTHRPNWLRKLFGARETTETHDYIGSVWSWEHYPSFDPIKGPGKYRLEHLLFSKWFWIDKEKRKKEYEARAEAIKVELPEIK